MTTPKPPMDEARLEEIKDEISEAKRGADRLRFHGQHGMANGMDDLIKCTIDLVAALEASWAEVERLQKENKRLEELDAKHRHERLGCCK